MIGRLRAMTLWCNGRWIAESEFPISPGDRGLLHGLGLFETLLALDGRPVFVDRHLARLHGAAARLAWSIDLADLAEVMTGLLQRNGLGEGRARIRLAITGGSGSIGDLRTGKDRLMWMSAGPAAELASGVVVNLAPWVRNECSPLAGLKCASYAENLVALDHARGLGFEETLFFNTRGNLCEAATANVFLIRNGILFTPDAGSGCLPGVTREVLLELASELGMTCRECALKRGDLDAASEVILSSSTRGVTSVLRIEDRDLPAPSVAPLLRQAWISATRRKTGG